MGFENSDAKSSRVPRENPEAQHGPGRRGAELLPVFVTHCVCGEALGGPRSVCGALRPVEPGSQPCLVALRPQAARETRGESRGGLSGGRAGREGGPCDRLGGLERNPAGCRLCSHLWGRQGTLSCPPAQVTFPRTRSRLDVIPESGFFSRSPRRHLP